MNTCFFIRSFEENGITKLQLFKNKKEYIVQLPFRPYFFSPTQINNLQGTKVKLRPVDTLKETELFKFEFDSVKDVPNYRTKDSIAADVPFLHRLSMDMPEFYEKYFQTDDLDILYLDIETDSVGVFPRADTNCIISIGYALNEEKPKVIYIKKLEDGDKELLETFNEVVEKFDPDVVVGYNLNGFDIPYLFRRMSRQNLDMKMWTRGDSTPYFISQWGNEVFNIQGRVMFDVIIEVFQDQTVRGVTKGLKQVARYFKVDEKIKQRENYEEFKIQEAETNMMRPLIGTKELCRYNESDVLITRELSKMYLANVIAFSEMLQVPLNLMLKRTTNMISSIFYARELKKTGIIECTRYNYKRHPEVFGELKEDAT